MIDNEAAISETADDLAILETVTITSTRFSNAPLYKYKKLAREEIRLLELFPGSQNSDLHGRITHHSLAEGNSEPPEYVALSYCWGESVLDRVIVHGEEQSVIPVTTSLHKALLHLRHERKADSPILVWADAISINQVDVEERNQQVLRMHHTYEQAKVVVAYFGEDEHNSEYIPLLVNVFMKQSRILSGQDLKNDLMLNQEYIVALKSFMRRPWFSRIWVIQEFACSRRIIMACGSWSMDMLPFTKLVAFFTANVSALGRATPAYGTMDMLRGLRQTTLMRAIAINLAEDKRLPLIKLLMACRASHATFDVDHLYAVLGISAEFQKEQLVPDYSESLTKAAMRYALYFIRSGGLPEILQQVDSRTWTDGMPSFVPDWCASLADPAWLQDELVSGRYPGLVTSHHAAGGRSNTFRFTEHQLNGQLSLRIRGRILDEVTELGRDRRSVYFRNFDLIEHKDISLRQFLLSRANTLIRMAKSGCLYERTGGIPLAIMDTLTAGMTSTWEQTSPKFREYWSQIYRTAKRSPSLKFATSDLTGWTVDREFSQVVGYLASTLRICKTKLLWFGQVPWGTEIGDKLAIFDGMRLPFVLRPDTEHKNAFRLVGPCYLQGVMDGGFWESMTRLNPLDDAKDELILV